MSGPVHPALAPLTVPASWLYAAAIRRRNTRFDRGVGVERLDRPVISIGNLTVGGTGKTPVVAWVAARLRAMGHHPVVAMRGYGAAPDGRSDEAIEHAERNPDVPVVVDPRRATALRAFLPREPQIDCVVLDDGFQHRQLARDLDIVLVDAERPALDGRLLPAGYLREPATSLARASAVIVTRATEIDDALARHITTLHGRGPVAWCRHGWRRLRRPGAEPAECTTAWLDGRRVVTMLGIARPGAVQRQLREAGATIVGDLPARDHQRYDAARIAALEARTAGADAVVMTSKDWAKARHLIDLDRWPVPIAIPEVEIEFVAGEPAVDTLLRETVPLATEAGNAEPGNP